jgi:transcriptional regulator
MYVPHFNVIEDEPAIRQMVADIGSAQVITVGSDGYPLAALLPIIWEGDTVIMHMSRANPHWKQIGPGMPALLVVSGPMRMSRPLGTRAKPNTARWCRRGTTPPCS